MIEDLSWKPGKNFGDTSVEPAALPTSSEVNEQPSGVKPCKRLLCVKEAIMPGRGHFQPGDEITDPDLIAFIGDNHPFFTVVDATINQEGN